MIRINNAPVLDHKYKVLLENIPGKHVITDLDKSEKIVQLRRHGITNFFILGTLTTIKHVLGSVFSRL